MQSEIDENPTERLAVCTNHPQAFAYANRIGSRVQCADIAWKEIG